MASADFVTHVVDPCLLLELYTRQAEGRPTCYAAWNVFRTGIAAGFAGSGFAAYLFEGDGSGAGWGEAGDRCDGPFRAREGVADFVAAHALWSALGGL